MFQTTRTAAIGLLFTLAFVINACDVLSPGDAESLRASGVVEVVEVSVSAEFGGRVAEVNVEAGDTVTTDQPLFSLDDRELQLQRSQIIVEGEAAVAAADLALLEARQALDDLNEDWPMQAAQYQVELAQARDELKKAENRRLWQQKNNRATEDTLEYYEAQLVLADDAVEDARKKYNNHKDKNENNPERAEARVALEQAEDERNQIVRNLNWYKGEPTDIDQALLDANVAIAKAKVDEAKQEFEKWREGPDPDAEALAKANIKYAEAALNLAQSLAESQVRAIDLKLEDTSIKAPSDGVVLTLGVEPGEVVTAGVAVIQLGVVDRMTLTVYLPENMYGLVSVGDSASVEVDSFPGEFFTAEVIRIADEAEYTPRNVQTEEERQTTVYAVKLRVQDPDGKLKPGMPADVIFEISTTVE